MKKPILKRYYAAYTNGWSFVVRDPGEWVWGYFLPESGCLRPFWIAKELTDMLFSLSRDERDD